MTTLVNYASKTTDTATSRAFEAALDEARTAVAGKAALGHIVAGETIMEGEVFERRDPVYPANVVGRGHVADTSLVSRAVDAARTAQKDWRRLAPRARVEHLRAAQREFDERKIEIAGIISAETGKSRLEALGEAQEAVDLIDWYATQVDKRGNFRARMSTANPGEENTTLLRPYGVFGVIGPFNFPTALCVNMSAAALLMGNAIVLKPSDKAPRSGALAGQILAKHLPAGVVNLLHGNADTGKALVASEVDGIAFTGSAEVGWNMVRELGTGAFAKPVLAEMGGKNVTVVGKSADLEAAAQGIIRSSFGLSGQKCSANSRVVVDRSVHDDLVAELVAQTKELVVGPPERTDTFMGPVVDTAAVARFEAAAEEARRAGTIAIGADRPDLEGHFVNPTIVIGLPIGHDLTRRELFLPFVTVTAVESFAEALEEANAVDYGLAAGVFSNEQDEIDEFLDRIEAGVTYVNRPSGSTTGAWPGIQSFCGWKSSGSAGKGGLGHWYLTGFAREQSRTLPVS